MHAARQRQVDPVGMEDAKVLMDFLWIAFTISFVVIIGKLISNSTAQEIVDFFEKEKYFPGIVILIISMSVVLIYGYIFYYFKRYEILVDLALDYVSAGQNNVLRLRSSFSWLRNLLALLQPSLQTCVYINRGFKYLFQFCLSVMAAFTGAFMCVGKETNYLSINVVVLAVYYAFAFSHEELTFERVIGHLGYTLVHAGVLLAYFNYHQISYICINGGFAVFMLCIVWYFVNVPMNRDVRRRRRP